MNRRIEEVKLNFNEQGECVGVSVRAVHEVEHPEAPGGVIRQGGRYTFNRDNLANAEGGSLVSYCDDVAALLGAPLMNSDFSATDE